MSQIFLNLAVHILICVIAWFTTRWAGMSDRVAVFFVSVQKTIVMGLPMLNELFSDDPLRDIYALPLIMYHPVQLIIGILLGGQMRKFIDASSSTGANDKEAGAGAQKVDAQNLPVILSDQTGSLAQAGGWCKADGKVVVADADLSDLPALVELADVTKPAKLQGSGASQKRNTNAAVALCLCHPFFAFPRSFRTSD